MASFLEHLAAEERTLVQCCLCGAQLRDPMQLDCLHDCCKVCAERQLPAPDATPAAPAGAGDAAAAAGVNKDAAEPPASLSGVTCPICNEMTDGARLSLDLFIDGHVRFLSILSGRPRCDICPAPLGEKEEIQAEREEAETLCFNCGKLLCSDCLREHRRLHGTHVTRALDQIPTGTELAERCFPPCPRHGKSMEHACLSCESPQCDVCASECMARGHDVQVLHCTSVKNRVNMVKRDVESFGPLLASIDDLRQRQDLLPEHLADVRREGLALLRRNKDAVLDAVERAHKKAEEALRSGCDELKKKADEHAAATARLHERASYASLVGRCVIDSDHTAAALSKRKPIAERLHHLMAELMQMEPAEGNERIVSYMEMQGGELHDEAELDSILEFLIGMPILTRGTNLVEYAHERNIYSERIEGGAQQRQHEQEVKKEAPQHQAESNDAPPYVEQQAFSTPTSPSISNSDSYGSTSLTPSSGICEDVPSLKEPTSPHVSEPSLGQCGRGTNRRQRVTRQRKEFVLKCSDCGSLVADSANLRILAAENAEDERRIIQHHVVIDKEFPIRVRIHRHWKPAFIGKTADSGFAMTKEYKLSCKKCSNDWGVCAKIQKKYFFLIKIDTLEVSADGVAEKVKCWMDLPYTLKFISDWQLLRFGHEDIPGDYPLPNRWYKKVPPQALI